MLNIRSTGSATPNIRRRLKTLGLPGGEPFVSRLYATAAYSFAGPSRESKQLPRYVRRQPFRNARPPLRHVGNDNIYPQVAPRGLKDNIKLVSTKDAQAAGTQQTKKLLMPHVLSARLKKLCDEGHVDKAVLMLKSAPLDAQNTPVWNTLIWECMKARRFKLGYELFTDMKRRGFSPTTRTFQTMFSGLSRVDHWPSHPKQIANAHSLYEYFQRHIDAVKRHDPHSAELSITPIGSYIKILGAAEEYQKIFDVYHSLDTSGPLSPNQFIFTAIFQALSERKSLSAESEQATRSQNIFDAKLLWKQMLKASERSPGFSVDSHLTSAAIVALSRGRPAEQSFAFEVVRDYLGLVKPGEVAVSGTFLTVQTLAAALALCNKMRQYSLCIHFLKQVMARPERLGGVSILDRGHMEEILKAYVAMAASGSAEEPNQALQTLEWMLRQEITGRNGPKIRPAATTFNLVLMACWRGADWDSAVRTFELMTGYTRRDFVDGMDKSITPEHEKRSKGRNIVPDAEAMSSVIRTALASRERANMRQALRMVIHVGSNHLFGYGSKSKGSAKHTTFYQVKLASALTDIIPQVLSRHRGKRDDEECASWAALKAEAEDVLRHTTKHPIPPLEEAVSDDDARIPSDNFIEYVTPRRSSRIRTSRM